MYVRNRIGRASGTTAAVAAASILLAGLGAGAAAAETQTGWVGSTEPINGVVYLHSSTISNVPAPTASSRVYTSFSTTAPTGTIGAQARLFKSGVLCSATEFQYNDYPVISKTVAVSRNCGDGSYNSNGFVAVWKTDHYATYVTFPTNPVNYPAATAKAQTPNGTNNGPTANAPSPAKTPDLVKAYGKSGKIGYVRSSDLVGPLPGSPTVARSATSDRPSSVPVYGEDKTTVIDTFALLSK